MRIASLFALLLVAILAGLYLFHDPEAAVPIRSIEDRPPGSEQLAQPSGGPAGNADHAAPAPLTASPTRDEVTGDFAVVRFVDALDGAPIAGLPYRVLEQGVSEREVVAGKTDTEGRVDTRDLPRSRWILETLRHPPFALSTHALDLREQSSESIDFAVSHGGTIAGIVQDADGAPLADVELYVTNGSMGLGGPPPLAAGAKSATTSDANGRFEVNAVASRSRASVIEEGELRPRNWEPVVVRAINPFYEGGPNADRYEHVEGGARVELERPLVFERSVICRGRVLDVDGEPAVDRFVTTRTRDRGELTGMPPLVLAHPPNYRADDFEWLEGEARTDAAGRFEFERPISKRVGLWVVGPSGIAESFSLDVERGADGVCEIGDVQLEFDQPIALRLLDEEGELITAERLAASAPGDEGGTRYGSRGDRDSVTVWLHTAAGTEEFEPGREVANGIVRLVTRVAPEDIRSVQVTSDRFRPARVVTPDGMTAAEPLEVTLTPNRSVVVLLEAAGRFEPDAGIRISVQLCTLSPERRASYLAEREKVSVGRASQYCCRLGGAHVLEWRGEDLTARLEAITDEALWVHAFGEGLDVELPLVSVGPIAAGDSEVTVRLDASTVVPREANSDALDPSVKDQRSTVVFTLLDAKTGEAIPEGRMTVPGDSPRSRPNTSRAMRRDDGRCHSVTFARGRLLVTIGATGYRSVDLGEHELRAGGTTDLGTVSLEPISPFRAHLLNADGSPLAEGTKIRFAGHFAFVEADGMLTVHEDLPPAFVMAIESHHQDQRVVGVEAWSADEVLEISVPLLRRVEIVVRGTDPLHTSIRAGLLLRVAHLELERFGDPATSGWSMPKTSNAVRSQTVRASGEWSFFTNLGIGSYTAELRSPLYDMAPTRIDVVEGEGIQVVELSVD
jgi:hypothetical protein